MLETKRIVMRNAKHSLVSFPGTSKVTRNIAIPSFGRHHAATESGGNRDELRSNTGIFSFSMHITCRPSP